MISIEQADKIKELVALIRKADEELSDFAWFSSGIANKGIDELEAKVDNALEALFKLYKRVSLLIIKFIVNPPLYYF